jgi:drug/metabolite transporter (DMT)-like permease
VKNSLGILLGLTAALCWGVSDFVARFASRRIGAYRALLFMQIVGFVALSAYLAATGGLSRSCGAGWHPWELAFSVGILNVLGSLALYYSFEVGVLTVVAPISSSYPAITVVLSVLSGERIRALNAAGLGLTLVGLILAAASFPTGPTAVGASQQKTPHVWLSKGVGWSLVSMVAFGIMFWFLGFYVLPVLDPALSVWAIRISTASMLLLAARPSRQSLRLPRGSVWWLLLAMGLMDTTAYVANNAGLQAGPVSILTVVASLYGAVTVLLSSLFLRERLARTQWLGVALIFAGIVLVSH